MSVTTVRLRFFASARAATGLEETDIALSDDTTIGAALSQLTAFPEQRIDAVLARCSFLVNGVATTDRTTELAADDVVDVMPPFAGG